jgi:hypothetical protein
LHYALCKEKLHDQDRAPPALTARAFLCAFLDSIDGCRLPALLAVIYTFCFASDHNFFNRDQELTKFAQTHIPT